MLTDIRNPGSLNPEVLPIDHVEDQQALTKLDFNKICDCSVQLIACFILENVEYTQVL